MKSNHLYEVMRDAIVYIRENASEHPSVSDMAKAVGMSMSRFEHAFAEWAGTSPKRFLAHLTKERAKKSLNSKNVLAAAYESGLSGPGRLHGLMVTHEAVSPGEFKSGDIEIKYGIHESPFGWCLLGVTKRGICYLSFLENNNKKSVELIKKAWPKACLLHDEVMTAKYIKKIFQHNKKKKRRLYLLIKGTNFQIKVWEALLKIPEGRISSYGEIARNAGSPKAVRAVGTACGKNNIAFLIPCHRVLTSNGNIGGYRWGTERKRAMLSWESVRRS